jgi:transposase
MRQTHRAGEKLFVDYAGQILPVIDPRTGEIRSAQIFVAVLGASNYTYAEATWSQSLPDWIGSHQRSFTFFDGFSNTNKLFFDKSVGKNQAISPPIQYLFTSVERFG